MKKKTTKRTSTPGTGFYARAKKAVKNRNAKVRRDNARFASLKPAEKRVAIARDVLKQLASGRLEAKAGTWLDTPGQYYLLTGAESQAKKDVELQTILKKREKCTGCALGGMFMCAVERANKLKVKDLLEFEQDPDEVWGAAAVEIEGDDAMQYLKRFFSEEQLAMIEAAFERGSGAFGHIGEEVSIVNASGFCAAEEEASERMRLIMENVIVNKGKFCPDQKPIEVITWETPGYEEEGW